MKRHIKLTSLVTSLFAIVLASLLLIGTTFAWFTDSVNSSGNKIQAGTLKVDLEILDKEKGWVSLKNEEKAIFDYVKWEPGYTDVKILKVENEGNLAFKWKAKFVSKNELSKLANVIDVYVLPSENELTYPTDRNLDGYTHVGTVADFVNTLETTTTGVLLADEEAYLGIALKMQTSAGNEYQGLDLGGAFDIMILATQLSSEGDGFNDEYDINAEYPTITTPWDGKTADTSWYNETDTEFSLSTAEQLAGLNELVDAGNTFAGKTIKLTSDVDLYSVDANGERVSFSPIGDKSPFEGTFDGQGNAVENLYQSGWAFGYEWGSYGSIGLFGEINNATIKNVTVSDAESYVEGGDVGGLVGSATGNCVFENIKIENSSFGTYNNGNGGIIGWSGEGNYTFKNIEISSDVVLGGLWGSFDSSIGGIVGQAEPGATYNFENVTVACRIDAYNDVTASYDYYNYRMCGMLIGRLDQTTTIDGANYPDVTKYNIICNNVTVIYGEWANYHYCRAEGARGKRVEPGYQYGGIAEDYDHSVCTVHHMELIAFDQIFGGDQLNVKGLKAYDGVNVIYNNK